MTDSEHIHKMVSEGYLSVHAEPLKCTVCESTHMKDTHRYEDGYVHHIVRRCCVCGKVLGEWAYGSWGVVNEK